MGALLRPGLRLDSVLGHGSFGVVYAGYQLAIERKVAVKVLHAAFAADLQAQRLFREEISAVGQIDHRNVVRIFDADSMRDGRSYFVMEHLSGTSLSELTRSTRLSTSSAVSLVAQVLDGLAAVHAAGRIHADLKPANIMVVEAAARDKQERDDAAPSAADGRAVLIDFGLSRLRKPGQEAVGGTKAFMAPEQRKTWALHERSDVYSAALVLVTLLIDWQPATDPDEGPPLERIEGGTLRAVLRRALAHRPEDRPSAEELADALRRAGTGPENDAPFRHLTPLTERDRRLLLGRDAELERLARALEADRPLVLTAASGTGKTSLLRAGLIPLLESRGLHCIYHSCAKGSDLPSQLWPGSATIGEALERWHRQASQRLVLVLDQVEALLLASQDPILEPLLDPKTRPAQLTLYVVLSVREDFLARLFARSERLASGVPQVRLAPLDRKGAQAALVSPLADAGLSLEESLLRELLEDLVRAGQAHGEELGWEDAIYPPHLQAAGAALVAALGTGETELTKTHYHRLGGFDAIVGEQVERAIGELDEGDRALARQLFLALLGPAHTRARCSEEELRLRCGQPADDPAVPRALERLEKQRLVVHRAHPTATWELAHDSLVERIERWLSTQDLERRRAIEVLRFHLRESHPGAPSLLSAQQLRFVAKFGAAVDELEREWKRRPRESYTPRSLIERSRAMQSYRRGLSIAVGVVVLGLSLTLLFTELSSRAALQREAYLRALDLGVSELVLRPFDDITETGELITATAPWPEFSLHLHEPSSEEPLKAGPRLSAERARFSPPREQMGALVLTLEARGGNAVLVIEARGRAGERCAPSMIPLRSLPGARSRGAPLRRVELPIPTCAASAADTVEIPAGPFIEGGAGEPASPGAAGSAERVRDLPAFRIDRTELSNGRVSPFAALGEVTGVVFAPYPTALTMAAGPRYPRTDWGALDAAAYCRFLGKELPTSAQWQKALRGGIRLADGSVNPRPRRNLPWGDGPGAAHIGRPTDGPAPVGSTEGDRSPYGVLDLAGNVQEWTATAEPDDNAAASAVPAPQRIRITRGGNWSQTTPKQLVDFLAIENSRSPRQVNYYLGARCAVTELGTAASAPD